MQLRPGIAVALVCFVAMVLAACTNSPEPGATTPPTAQQSASRVPFDEARARSLEQALTSGEPSTMRDALALPDDVVVPQSAWDALAALEGLEFQTDTFADLGGGTGSVLAAAGGTQWKVYLVQIERQWLVASTSPAD